MPTYDFECERCGRRHELNVPITRREDTHSQCAECGGLTNRAFSPNANILIPTAFRTVTQGFQGPGGPDSAPYSNNNSVHAPKRQSFTEAFDVNVKKSGGIG